jgi:hypothetical protein
LSRMKEFCPPVDAIHKRGTNCSSDSSHADFKGCPKN